MIYYDFHTHSSFSSDSEEPAERQIEEAVRLGLKGICFTDHMDLEFPEFERSGCSFEFNPDSYFAELERLRARYSDKIKILCGVEFGLRNEAGLSERIGPRYEKLAADYPFDFIIGSTHCLENVDPYYGDYWEDKKPTEGIRSYFDAVLYNLRSYSCYDSCGHLDYIVRYVPRKPGIWEGVSDYHPDDYTDLFDEIFKYLIDNGKALECNSAGLKYGLGFAHPKKELLIRYRELGGELLTIGSDSHKTEHLAYGFDSVCEMLKACGFRYYTIYEGRQPEMIKL